MYLFSFLISMCNEVLHYFDDNLKIIIIVARMLNAAQEMSQHVHYFNASFEVNF